MRSYHRNRKDAPHKAVKEALQRAGCLVLDVSGSAGLGCDLVVFTGFRTAYCVEVKDGTKKRSAQALTDSEARLAFQWPQYFRVVSSVGEALALMGGR